MEKRDKERYKREMAMYKPPEGDDDDDDEEQNEAKGGKKKRKKKDPNAPKRPMTAYLLYSNDIRKQVKEENPDFSFGDIVSVTTLNDNLWFGSHSSCFFVGKTYFGEVQGSWRRREGKVEESGCCR